MILFFVNMLSIFVNNFGVFIIVNVVSSVGVPTMLLSTIFGTSKRQLLAETSSSLRLLIKMDSQSIVKNLESEFIDAKAIQFIFHFA